MESHYRRFRGCLRTGPCTGKRAGVAVALSLAAATSLPALAADSVVPAGETVNGGTLINHDRQFVSGTADGMTVSTGLELGADSDNNTGGQQIARVEQPETPESPQTVYRMSWQVAVPRIRLSVPGRAEFAWEGFRYCP